MADFYDTLQDSINSMNYDSADRQMRFQEYMSSTAHRREVADLVAAGLNPVLSANQGAAALPGAYATIDSSPTAAKAAEKQLQMQLDNQYIMNKYSTDVGYQLGIAQAGISAGATIAAAGTAAAASRYAADIALQNNREQRAWDSAHPSNAYQATGSVIEALGNVFSNTAHQGASYAPGGSSAR